MQYTKSNSLVKIPMTPLNYLTVVSSGALSDSNISQKESLSRSSTKVPLVMRHCYVNNEKKK